MSAYSQIISINRADVELEYNAGKAFQARIFGGEENRVSRFHGVEAEETKNKIAHKNLRQIPGVGPRIAEDLTSIGIRSVTDLKGKDPEQLYRKLCRHVGKPVDRCMLYVFRLAVYFASNSNHKPELLKWWNWKDKKHPHGMVKRAK